MAGDLAERVSAHPFWYHRLDLGNGLHTPGEWHLDKVVDRLPWPEVAGKRCLDIATFDGFYAFELERRGAAEVVAVDISSWDEADLSWDMRQARTFERKFEDTTWRHGSGFKMAHEALGSRVEWRNVSIYDLSPETVGTFDVITCGSLLLHLRDPIAALEAVRSVCGGVFLSVEAIDPWLTVAAPRFPLARFRGRGKLSQWWNVNSAGHAAWLESAGFEILERSKPIVVPRKPGAVQPPRLERMLTRALTGMPEAGVLHRAALAWPRQA